MPELPDLHVFAKNLRKSVLDVEIVSLDIFNLSKVNATVESFRQKAVGARIVKIDRDGKELYFTLSGGDVFSVHLMLFGRFTLCPSDQIFAINAKIIVVGLSGGRSLVVNDTGNMAKVTLNPKPRGGPDVLSEAFTYASFQKAAQKSARAEVKAFLIDQSAMKGIGNAYVDEILWKADIAPESITGRIPEDRLRVLYDTIPEVLLDAIVQIERIAPDIIAGEERSFLKVHNSRKKVTDEGEPILVKTVAGKKTYCTAKQKLYI